MSYCMLYLNIRYYLTAVWVVVGRTEALTWREANSVDVGYVYDACELNCRITLLVYEYEYISLDSQINNTRCTHTLEEPVDVALADEKDAMKRTRTRTRTWSKVFFILNLDDY